MDLCVGTCKAVVATFTCSTNNRTMHFIITFRAPSLPSLYILCTSMTWSPDHHILSFHHVVFFGTQINDISTSIFTSHRYIMVQSTSFRRLEVVHANYIVAVGVSCYDLHVWWCLALHVFTVSTWDLHFEVSRCSRWWFISPPWTLTVFLTSLIVCGAASLYMPIYTIDTAINGPSMQSIVCGVSLL
jgi:hypothetical protein